MRCPKCGYISFDYLDTCLKCKKNIKKASDALRGSVYNAVAPSFLKFDSDPNLDEMAALEDDLAGIEVQDPELAVLLQGESEDDGEGFEPVEDTELSSDFFDNIEEDFDGEESEEFSEVAVEETDEVEMVDFVVEEEDAASLEGLETADTEDAAVAEVAVDEVRETNGDDDEDDDDDDDGGAVLRLDLPDELSDISDLAPTDKKDSEKDFSEDFPAGLSDDDSFDLDTDFNLDLGSLDLHDMPDPAALSSGDPENDFSPVDDDLDFDLDLEGLSLGDK